MYIKDRLKTSFIPDITATFWKTEKLDYKHMQNQKFYMLDRHVWNSNNNLRTSINSLGQVDSCITFSQIS